LVAGGSTTTASAWQPRKTSVVIPNSGHWLMEEQPAATVAAIRAFLDK
jgi:pimeloyl-ACP methyl ester carboxylesterase